MRPAPPPSAGRPLAAHPAAQTAVFVGSPIYRGSSYGAAHPLRIPRVSTVMDLAGALGWLPAARYRSSPRAKAAALCRWHSPAYVAALMQAEATGRVTPEVRARHHLGTLSNPVFPEMFRRPATGAGGVMWAAEVLAGARPGDPAVIHVPGGGTHHGLPDRASGFCYLNDVVLGIGVMLSAGVARVAYVDLDAHHGDGVEAAFADDPRVLTISVHEEGRWPFTGGMEVQGPGVVNLPVPRDYNDTEARAVLHGLILPRVAAFGPQVLVVQCGADSLAEDPLSRLGLSNRAYLEALDALRGLAPRLLVLGGGGYNPWAVGRLWTAIWGLLSGQDMPHGPEDGLPPAATAVLAGLGWNGGARPPPAPALTRSLIDAPREGPLRPEIRARLARVARP